MANPTPAPRPILPLYPSLDGRGAKFCDRAAEPLTIAAIDAGSNAIRMTVARAVSAGEIYPVACERCAVRLGRHAFVRREIDGPTLESAAAAFRRFREVLDEHGVSRYRAVATSASREARNGGDLVKLAKRHAGLSLEIIDCGEEARLVREAVHAAWGGADHLAPRVIVDLGGGSLEISLFSRGRFQRAVALPLGTVRLMEMFGLNGAIDEETEEELRGHVLATLRGALPSDGSLAGALTVACGGNAEALAELAPGDPFIGMPALDLFLLSGKLPGMLAQPVSARMKSFGVRRDRAEVMSVAAVVLTCLGRALGVASFVVPGVGVREGILLGLARAHSVGGNGNGKAPQGDKGHAHLSRAARNSH